MAGWLSFKGVGPIGVDLGTRSVKLVQFSADRKRLIETARWDLPTDESSEPDSPDDIEAPSARGTKPDPVAVVTARARVIADRRSVGMVHTTDILAALMDVYGATFADTLQQHGISTADIVDRLDLGLPGTESAE